MYKVIAFYTEIMNKGTQNEKESSILTPQKSGPFETRDSAERFTHGLAANPLTRRVEIEEVE